MENFFVLAVKAILPTPDQWSFQHVRLFGGHNHVHVNPWTLGQQARHVYFVLTDGIYGLPIVRVSISFLFSHCRGGAIESNSVGVGG